ncbi:MAG TPA: hypothetical protein VHA12_01490 [Candidatus Nanoarchaeia archaeon]|nr:hypothetical protein [Candidatus Nanoarchaeia archaeon]
MAFQPVSIKDERIAHLPVIERDIFFGAPLPDSEKYPYDYKYLRVNPLEFDIARIAASPVEAKDCNVPHNLVRYVAGIQNKDSEHYLVCLTGFFQEHSGAYRAKASDVSLVNLDSVINYESLR